MPSSDNMRARLFLLRAAEPPAPATHQYVGIHGALDAAAHIRHSTTPAAVLDEITWPDARIDDDLEALDNGTARLLTPEDDDWPSGPLTSLDNRAPLALWVRGSGSLAELTTSAVTVTGSHDASGYGNTVAADFGYELARTGVTVISSGGYGVDEAAQRGALAADGRMIVVLANGVDRPHPHQQARLFEAVVDQGGLLVSEYPIGTPPTRTRIHARCRPLAALGAATLIVEAGCATAHSPWREPPTNSAEGSTECPARSTRPRRRASMSCCAPAPPRWPAQPSTSTTSKCGDEMATSTCRLTTGRGGYVRQPACLDTMLSRC